MLFELLLPLIIFLKITYLKFVGFVTLVGILPLYAIKVNVVSLFTDSSFLIFSDLELYYSMYSINLNE
jgi:hypothetical protein